MNIDAALARNVSRGLRLKDEPTPAAAARPTRQDLPASPALSILLHGPKSLAGRKIGALVTDGTDASLLEALRAQVEGQGALLKLVAPMVGGIEASDGSWVAADEKLDGGPSVLFDAVAILPSAAGAAMLASHPAARDFVADTYAHFKFIGFTEAAGPLLVKAGIAEADRDEGFARLSKPSDVEAFLASCRELRFWQRELSQAKG